MGERRRAGRGVRGVPTAAQLDVRAAQPRPESFIDRITRAMHSHAPTTAERDEPFREAGVALVLRPRAETDAEVLLIRRAERAGDPWSGQVALPGGRHSAIDTSLEDTAVRETLEEVGLDIRANGTVLGALDDLRPRTPALPPIIVRPFVCVVPEPPPLELNYEVAASRWIPVSELFAPSARVQTTVEVRNLRMRVDAYVVDDYLVWGMTERILFTLQRLSNSVEAD